MRSTPRRYTGKRGRSRRDPGTGDLIVYHLGMLTESDRTARRRRYETLDPDHRWQRIGYAHLTDQTGLRLARVPRRRGWVECRFPAVPPKPGAPRHARRSLTRSGTTSSAAT